MAFDFSFLDLALWLSASAVIMLIGSEFLSPYFGRKNTLFNLGRLRIAAIVFGIAFLFTIAMRVIYLLYV